MSEEKDKLTDGDSYTWYFGKKVRRSEIRPLPTLPVNTGHTFRSESGRIRHIDIPGYDERLPANWTVKIGNFDVSLRADIEDKRCLPGVMATAEYRREGRLIATEFSEGSAEAYVAGLSTDTEFLAYLEDFWIAK